MTPLTLRTARLDIRDLVPDDWRAVHDYASDEAVTRYLSWGPNTEQDTRAFVDAACRDAAEQPRRNFALGVVDRETATLIGGCGLLVRREEYGEYEVGYCFHRDWWGRGFGTESVRALVGFAFRSGQAHRIYALVDPENHASSRLLQDLGFRLEGHQRQDSLIRGEWRDSLVYGVLENEWPG